MITDTRGGRTFLSANPLQADTFLLGVTMIPRVKNVIPLPDYRIEVTFNDGASGVVDIGAALGFKGMFERLRDPEFFKRVRVGRSSRTVEWSSQLDLDPVVLYSRATGKSVEWILAQDEPPKTAQRRKTAVNRNQDTKQL